jgi:two-component system, chemotaxis family, protein-glutamate methylesterase/glutaminase
LTSSKPLRVLVCEDSLLYSTALRRMLEFDGDIKVAAVCDTAEEAIAALPGIDPGLVTMDIVLPGMDGLAAVEHIMSSRPLPVLVLSSYLGPSNDKAAAALAAGALEAVSKDDLDLRDPASAAGAAFRHRVKVLSRAHVIRHMGGALLKGTPGAHGPPHRTSVIGLCASTGGPQILALLLTALPADYPIPILVVQHIAAGFTHGLARWLNQTTSLPVDIAVDGSPASAGAWIAPAGAHLKLAATGRLSLDRHTVVGRHRPSCDALLESIALAAGKAGVAVVLSGMGADGAVGAASVRRAGGLTIAQDEESSVVFGMPKAAIDLGVDVVLSPANIAAYLLGLRHVPFAGAR